MGRLPSGTERRGRADRAAVRARILFPDRLAALRTGHEPVGDPGRLDGAAVLRGHDGWLDAQRRLAFHAGGGELAPHRRLPLFARTVVRWALSALRIARLG